VERDTQRPQSAQHAPDWLLGVDSLFLDAGITARWRIRATQTGELSREPRKGAFWPLKARGVSSRAQARPEEMF